MPGLNQLTLADGDTVGNDLLAVLSGADSGRAVTETVAEVGVVAEALDVVGGAAELLGLASSHHVVGAGLLEGVCQLGGPMRTEYWPMPSKRVLTPQAARLEMSWAEAAAARALRAKKVDFILIDLR